MPSIFDARILGNGYEDGCDYELRTELLLDAL